MIFSVLPTENKGGRCITFICHPMVWLITTTIAIQIGCTDPSDYRRSARTVRAPHLPAQLSCHVTNSATHNTLIIAHIVLQLKEFCTYLQSAEAGTLVQYSEVPNLSFSIQVNLMEEFRLFQIINKKKC
jgi:hypothetical protein